MEYHRHPWVWAFASADPKRCARDVRGYVGGHTIAASREDIAAPAFAETFAPRVRIVRTRLCVHYDAKPELVHFTQIVLGDTQQLELVIRELRFGDTGLNDCNG